MVPVNTKEKRVFKRAIDGLLFGIIAQQYVKNSEIMGNAFKRLQDSDCDVKAVREEIKYRNDQRDMLLERLHHVALMGTQEAALETSVDKEETKE